MHDLTSSSSSAECRQRDHESEAQRPQLCAVSRHCIRSKICRSSWRVCTHVDQDHGAGGEHGGVGDEPLCRKVVHERPDVGQLANRLDDGETERRTLLVDLEPRLALPKVQGMCVSLLQLRRQS